MIRTVLIALLVVPALAGCATLENVAGKTKRVTFDGKLFRASAQRSDDDRARFFVTVNDAGKSLKGAREAGRYKATEYCIKNFGTSRIAWVAGPDVADEALQLSVSGQLQMEGVCTP